MSSQPVVVFLDSGKGGLPYLKDYHRHNQSQSLIYVADTASFPYGLKDKAELCHILQRTIERIVMRLNPALIVLACNTASVTALTWLRQRISVPLVGVVPAVKSASAKSSAGKIGLLVTERTATGNYLHDLIGQFAADQAVITVIASDIVNYIEHHATSLSITPSPEINTLIKNTLQEFTQAGTDTIILGCTHFLYIADLLKTHLEGTITVIDSRKGVTNRIKQLTASLPTQPVYNKKRPPICHTTSTISPSLKKLLAHCDIRYEGIL